MAATEKLVTVFLMTLASEYMVLFSRELLRSCSELDLVTFRGGDASNYASLPFFLHVSLCRL
jgi:hypothetical protein